MFRDLEFCRTWERVINLAPDVALDGESAFVVGVFHDVLSL